MSLILLPCLLLIFAPIIPGASSGDAEPVCGYGCEKGVLTDLPYLCSLIPADHEKAPSLPVTASATMITRSIAITAARPFISMDKDQMATAYVLACNLKNRCDPKGAVLRRLQAVSIYPGHDQKTLTGDLALVRLVEPMPAWVGFICLASSTVRPTGGRSVHYAGFGVSPASGVQHCEKRQEQAACCSEEELKSSPILPYLMNTPDAITFGCKNNYTESCCADAGSAAIFISPDQKRCVQYGVITFGLGCSLAGYPGVAVTIESPTKGIWMDGFINS